MKKIKQNKKNNHPRFKVHDHYYSRAKEEGFAARSVFKLEEINKKFKVIASGDIVIDLGCAPGSWMQYSEKIVAKKKSGLVIGIDLQELKQSFPAHVHVLQGDIYDIDFMDHIPEAIKNNNNEQFCNVMLSDMAPNTTGIKHVDQDRSTALCEHALMLAQKHLKPGGNFVSKIFEGRGFMEFIKDCRQIFAQVKIFCPKSTRASSKETFVIGLNKK